MQTRFSTGQLANPDAAESERILRACVHCGFCSATCPTYLLTGDELDGPRGRIYLAKDMLEKNRPADPVTVKHLDRCLTCLACMTTCPSGVHYQHLMDHARKHIEQTYQRPWVERLLRSFLARTLPYSGRFRWALRLGHIARPLRGLLPRTWRAPLDLLPPSAPAPDIEPHIGAGRSAVTPRAPRGLQRVALLEGCVQPVLRPAINAATRRLLGRLGVEAVSARNAGCCGALVHHLGREHQALQQARANIDAWTQEIDSGGLDAIVITTSGCGTMIKDYGFLFRNDPRYARKAARIASLTLDVSELLEKLPLPASGTPPALRVAYHSACSLQHGQKIHASPAALLARMGFDVHAVPESHLCCGSAGTYNLLQPEFARALATARWPTSKRSGRRS